MTAPQPVLREIAEEGRQALTASKFVGQASASNHSKTMQHLSNTKSPEKRLGHTADGFGIDGICIWVAGKPRDRLRRTS